MITQTQAAPVREIKVNGGWLSVDENVFRSWAGHRRVDGVAFHGPIFYFLSSEPASVRQARPLS